MSILHIYHYNEIINQILHYIIEKITNMRKTSNKKHFRGGKVYFMFLSFIKKAKSKILFFFFFFIDDLIDNEQKSCYNK